MSSRIAAVVIAILAVVAVGEAVLLFQFGQAKRAAAIELRVTNAGLELGPDDGRIYVHLADGDGGLVAEGAFGAAVSVPPGKYDVRAVFSRSKDQQDRWLRGVALSGGDRATSHVEFNSGELSVEAEGAVGAEEIVVYVFRQGDHDRVVTSMAAGEPVLVAPGTYDVRVVLTQNSEERAIQWREDVPVQAGLQTKISMRFRQGTLLVNARNGGSALPEGAVGLTLFRAGDADREVVAAGSAATPLRLATGRYDVRATFAASNDKPVQWLTDVEISDGETHERVIEFASGTVVLRAEVKNGEALDDFQTYVYYYRAGQHQQPVAYVPAPAPVVLGSGRYDVRVNYFRSHDRPDIWIRDLDVTAGEEVTRSVAFASGKLLIRAYDEAGVELVGDNVFVRVHAAGERSRAIAAARSGEFLVLTEGAYDVVAEDTRSPGVAVVLEGVSVVSGRLAEHALTFADK